MGQDLSLGVLAAAGLGVLLLCSQCGSSDRSLFGDADGGDSGATVTDDSGVSFGDVVAQDVTPPPIDKCHVPPDGENAGTCTKSSPPNSFAPQVKWTWTAPPPQGGQGGYGIEGSIVTPLVGNFTDDNGDGEVNLCDVPDVIVTISGGGPGAAGQIYMLAGDTGKVEYTFDGFVDASVSPAFGDIDGDGLPEVVTNDIQGHLVAYDNHGHVKWVGKDVGVYKQNMNSYCHAIGIYDLDGDGNPEIVAAFEVFDNKGNHKFNYDESAFQGQYWCPANTAADLDGDGKLEVIFGNAALHADGSVYWTIPGPPGQPQVANLDSDPEPEIFIARQDGVMVLENNGAVKLGPVQLYDKATSPNCWSKPAVVTDFDGDGHADIANSSCNHFTIYHLNGTNLSVSWSQPINDTSGLASATAFDFLGRGVADAVYGDQDALYVFDGATGKQELTYPRSSGTLIEYPVVADVDNDGSADIVVVSNKGGTNPANYENTVEVLEDAQKRWIPTRRIWNQHAYSVENVREDGTIPKTMPKSWQKLNTFRVNAQIEGGGDCAPPPPNPK